MKEKHQKKYNNGKKADQNWQTNKQKNKNQKKGEKEVFQLTIEGAKYLLDLTACYEKKNGQGSL